jgi:hypothetical protein
MSPVYASVAGVIVPPIPEKTTLSVDDPAHPIIFERRFLLKAFIQSVGMRLFMEY